MKTPKELGITEPQRAALVNTLELMETGKLRHISAKNVIVAPGYIAFGGLFNMTYWIGYDNYNCGTVACIGGTAELVGGVEFFDSATDNLNLLFYPSLRVGSVHPNEITVEQAARALRSYLETGRAEWAKALENE